MVMRSSLFAFLCVQLGQGINWNGPASTVSQSMEQETQDSDPTFASISQLPHIRRQDNKRCGFNDSFSTPQNSTSTNLGPLTTHASFPDNCFSSYYNFQTFGLGWNVSFVIQGCAIKTCCPDGNFYTEDFAWMTRYYSPGVCPVGYRTCNPPPSPTALSSATNEVIKFCCPADFDCPVTRPGMNFGACFGQLWTSADITVMEGLLKQESVTTYQWPPNMFPCIIAYPLQIRTGVDASQTTSATTTTAASQLATAGASSSNLSGGAIAGIVIGVVVGIALLAAIVWFFMRRQIQNGGRPSPESVIQQGPSFTEVQERQMEERGELEGFGGATRVQYELPGRPAELGTSSAQPPLSQLSKDSSMVH